MKIIVFISFLFLLSGCGKITDLTSSKSTDTKQTEETMYDNQEEMKLLLPWNIFL